MSHDPIRVLCIDDNQLVGAALERHLCRFSDIECVGLLDDAGSLPDAVARLHPHVIVLDIDMPGKDPFEAAAELAVVEPDVRVIFFSGHIRQDLIDRAVDAGAWGYISKDDGEPALLDAIRSVRNGRFTLGPGVKAVLERRR